MPDTEFHDAILGYVWYPRDTIMDVTIYMNVNPFR